MRTRARTKNSALYANNMDDVPVRRMTCFSVRYLPNAMCVWFGFVSTRMSSTVEAFYSMIYDL
jgi:hypothetical protein